MHLSLLSSLLPITIIPPNSLTPNLRILSWIVQLKFFLAEKFGDNNEQVGLAVTLLDLLGFCFITGCLLPSVLRWHSSVQTLGSIWEEQKPQNCTASKAWKVILLSCIQEVPPLNLGCDTSSPDRVFLVLLSFSWQILILYLG